MTSSGSAGDSETRGPWLRVDLAAIRRNAERYRASVGVPILPMIKANGYGLGAVAVARALEGVDPWGYGVATVSEAVELRQAGIARPILVVVPFAAHQLGSFRRWNIRPLIGDREALTAWLASGDQPFHLAIDTGMSRVGWQWRDPDLATTGRAVATASGFEGIMTHFHSADSDPAATAEQWRRFEAVIGAIGAKPPLVHAANSAAGRFGTRYAGSLARPGIFLYGGAAGDWRPEPVARVEATVVAVRSAAPGQTVSYGATYRAEPGTDIVTLGIGYADGVHRSLSNRGLVAIGGGVYPIAGRVTMDMTMVPVPAGSVAIGDRATLWGGPIDLDTQADRAGTISYELLTAIGPRVVRCYQGATP